MAELEQIELPEDMTQEEKESVMDYINNGLPGITKAKQSDIFQWFQLYMSGKTYTEISNIAKSKKNQVMYISHKLKWHETKMKHYQELVSNLTEKLTHVKLSSANTMTNIVTALGKYYDKKFNDYISKNDSSLIEDVDTRLLSQYFKSMDTLDKIVSSGKSKNPKDGDPSPLVNINMMGGATVEKVNDQTIEITDENAGEFLKSLAMAKKSQKSEDL